MRGDGGVAGEGSCWCTKVSFMWDWMSNASSVYYIALYYTGHLSCILGFNNLPVLST